MIALLDRMASLIGEMKFNPEQPRSPAGTAEGGQWVGNSESGLAGDIPAAAIAASGGSLLKERCEAQFDRDIFQCRMVGSRSCYDQAYQRYSACLARQQIPPFNY